MSNFDETSGAVPCPTSWGCWYQTLEEVFIEVNLPGGTSGKQVKVSIKAKHLTVTVIEKTLIHVRIGKQYLKITLCSFL